MPYSSHNSRVRNDTLDHAAGVRLPDDLKAWPGVGPVTAAKLKADGIPDFIHLLAKYCTSYKRDDQRMYDYLKSQGIDGQHRNTIVSALKARVAETERRNDLPRDQDPRISPSMWQYAERNGYVQNGVPTQISQYNDHKPVQRTSAQRESDERTSVQREPDERRSTQRYESSSTARAGSSPLASYMLLAAGIMLAWFVYKSM